MDLVQYNVHLPIGNFYLIASDKGLKGVHFTKQAVQLISQFDLKQQSHQHLSQAALQLKEYCDQKRQQFDIPLDIDGTVFQQQVWKELTRIPYGRTVSYKTIAQRIKNPKAVRAVGSANGKNPVCIIIPCHRVIAVDGSIGGYAGGLPLKRKLLAIEK